MPNINEEQYLNYDIPEQQLVQVSHVTVQADTSFAIKDLNDSRSVVIITMEVPK